MDQYSVTGVTGTVLSVHLTTITTMCCALCGISIVVSCEPVHHSVAVCPIAGSNRSTEAEPSRSSSEGDWKPPQPEGLDPLERTGGVSQCMGLHFQGTATAMGMDTVFHWQCLVPPVPTTPPPPPVLAAHSVLRPDCSPHRICPSFQHPVIHWGVLPCFFAARCTFLVSESGPRVS